MKFLSILTRCRDEFFIKEWVDYYLSQGVDSIYIIDDDSENKSIYNFVNNDEYRNVNMIYKMRHYENTTTAKQCLLDKNSPSNEIFRSKIKGNYEWMIYCDVDEFIATKKHFNKTIKERLQQISNNSITCIAIPWVFMSGAKLLKNPKSVLREVIYRHDHDKKHPNSVRKFRCRYDEIECKSILKPSAFEYLLDHGPFPHRSPINGCDLSQERLTDGIGGRFLELRNEDIENGEFLCYHYRYISDEYAKSKLKTNGWYINDGYSFDDLRSSSYPEIYDDTLLRKIEMVNG